MNRLTYRPLTYSFGNGRLFPKFSKSSQARGLGGLAYFGAPVPPCYEINEKYKILSNHESAYFQLIIFPFFFSNLTTVWWQTYSQMQHSLFYEKYGINQRACTSPTSRFAANLWHKQNIVKQYSYVFNISAG